MGYVGCVSAGCLADLGHDVVAVEPSSTKLDMINEGNSPIIEAGMDQLIGNAVKARKLYATQDWSAAIQATDLAMLCVGTPSRENGSIDLRSIVRVCEQIGEALASKKEYFTVVVRSTVLPGTVENTVLPILIDRSGKTAGVDFGVCMNPEFLREGSSIADFRNPPKTIIGQLDQRSGDRVERIYETLPGPVIRTSLRVAELVKYTDNCFHALKVTFANEIGDICKQTGIDSHELMDIFCQDTKLNLSPSYLKPGFAFGGSCLPKDLRAIIHEAKTHDLEVPMLSSILHSNDRQVQNLVDKLMTHKGRSLGFLGLSFKGGTDDLRSSPIVDVIEALLGKGFEIKIYDQHVSLAKLMGANKEYIEREIPHISKLMCGSARELVEHSDVVVLCHHDETFRQSLQFLTSGQSLYDLVRIAARPELNGCDYHGLSW